MKIKLDPITRIEGHLSVSLDIEDGKVAAAYSAGTMFRGFEMILQGRDPLDAVQITQRICGVCPVDHGVAASLGLDQALGLDTPDNGRLLRNLIVAANHIQDHILHFYHLSALDFIDIKAVTQYRGNDQGLLELRDWVQAELQHKKINPAAPFLPRYRGTYIKDTDLNLTAIKNYLAAFRTRALSHEMLAVFGGKAPHAASLVPSGVTAKPTINRVEAFRSRLKDLQHFIDTAYLPDVIAISQAFPDYFNIGYGSGNLLAYGGFPEDAAHQHQFMTGGVYRNGRLESLDLSKIAENTTYTWVTQTPDLHPSRGHTEPAPHKPDAYSWIKAPRYDGAVMEVGPMARLMIAHHLGHNPAISGLLAQTLARIDQPLKAMQSVMGRHLARALECKLLADRCEVWLDQLRVGEPATAGAFKIPATGQGVGLTEAARGGLGHWLEISDGRIKHYECVVPTTWNCSPRDDQGQPGPMEQALADLPIEDQANPIEATRVVRSFDPCLACAVH